MIDSHHAADLIHEETMTHSDISDKFSTVHGLGLVFLARDIRSSANFGLLDCLGVEAVHRIVAFLAPGKVDVLQVELLVETARILIE